MARYSHHLVERLRLLQQHRHEQAAVRDHAGALDTLHTAVSLIDPLDLPTLREALLHATNPASVPPVPVVLGPQDVAAVIAHDEITALINKYGHAAQAYGRSPGDPLLGKACQRAWHELRAAIEPLCRATPPVELGGGR